MEIKTHIYKSVKVKNLQKRVKIKNLIIEKWAEKTLAELKKEKAELSVLLVDDAQIKKLNYQYRQENIPTDVLAFRMGEGKFSSFNPALLGDVVISLERAKAQAKRFSNPIEREICLYLVHGILHLTGYRDETEASKRRMEKKQEEILKQIYQD